MNIWGEVVMKGQRKLHTGRVNAGMIVVGKSGTENFYLCVFGGEDEEVSNALYCLVSAHFMGSLGRVRDRNVCCCGYSREQLGRQR